MPHEILNVFKHTGINFLSIENEYRSSLLNGILPPYLLEILAKLVSFETIQNIEKGRKLDYGKEYANYPFVGHLDDVTYLTAQCCLINPEIVDLDSVILAANLHDICEDLPAETQILYDLPVEVIELVHALTDCSGKNRKERKTKTYEKYARFRNPYEFAIVKGADRLANFVRSIETDSDKVGMYIHEHHEIMKYLQGTPLTPILERVYSYAYYEHLRNKSTSTESAK